jgi:hypothetical protein
MTTAPVKTPAMNIRSAIEVLVSGLVFSSGGCIASHSAIICRARAQLCDGLIVMNQMGWLELFLFRAIVFILLFISSINQFESAPSILPIFSSLIVAFWIQAGLTFCRSARTVRAGFVSVV